LSENERMQNPEGHLMAYAFEWLAEWSGHKNVPLPASLPAGARRQHGPYRDLLGGAWEPPDPGDPLLSIFSRVRGPDGKAEVPQRYWPARDLMLDQVAMPKSEAEARQADREVLWRGFTDGLSQVLKLPSEAGNARLEAFGHLLHRCAWAVTCSYGEPGVSLYEEFRALAALVYASGCSEQPADQFLLVGGDIPGIQKTIYTITSKGAAKGLRGRSFFIQLLGDAVVRRLLAELGLPEANVIYTAGGNFMLLAPAGVGTKIDGVGVAINQKLLKAFESDLALCLAYQELDADQVGDAAFATKASRELKNQIGRQKRRRFADIAQDNWQAVFAPDGEGGVRFCAVCQHEWKKGERGKNLEDGGWVCPQCAGFEELAQDIARDRPLMLVGDQRPEGPAKGWQDLLWEVTGQWYDFLPDLKRTLPPGARVYRLNEPDFLDGPALGFRLIANTTPKNADGQVRTFEDLAEGAEGLKRVGVLRMDVDDLGRVLTQWLPERTMTSTSALSHALDRFFTGWLDAICQEVMAQPPMKGAGQGRSELLYVIYAGGDDLFVVGAWDLMPLLADQIQQYFAAYVGGNPHLHISAGITLEDRKFPLYQAADRAGDALDHGAKEMPERPVDGQKVKKSAVTFLGKTVGWEKVPFVKDLTEQLIDLTEKQGVPRSLLGTMRAIHDRYYEDVRRARERGLEGNKVYYGPWMWRKVYQLSRIGQRYEREAAQQVAEQIKDLETRVLTRENMPFVGLATRWAEYLTRGGRDHE
jgi:CRISPR-associated protein Csm1